jgi:hypothetical protein
MGSREAEGSWCRWRASVHSRIAEASAPRLERLAESRRGHTYHLVVTMDVRTSPGNVLVAHYRYG